MIPPLLHLILLIHLGNYINAGIWSAIEPGMAVICACIPSLRPLFSIATRSIFKASPMIKSKLSTGTSFASKRTWGSSKRSDGTFSHLDEHPDDMKPLGHDVSVRAGRVNATEHDAEALELPQRGIQVQREVQVTTEKVDYLDYLF